MVHIFFLIGFRNRVRVMLEWMWYYVTFKPGARIIFEQPGQPHNEPRTRRPSSGRAISEFTARGFMKPRITMITIGVDDLERSLMFYRDGLGLPTRGIVGTEFEHGSGRIL